MDRSTFLFATPSWAEGVGRLFDFGDTLTQYNEEPTAIDADMRALAMDWAAVGSDLAAAAETHAPGPRRGRHRR